GGSARAGTQPSGRGFTVRRSLCNLCYATHGSRAGGDRHGAEPAVHYRWIGVDGQAGVEPMVEAVLRRGRRRAVERMAVAAAEYAALGWPVCLGAYPPD